MLNENKGAIGSLAASVALIVGSLLPWLSEIDGFEREGFFYGVGIGGWGYGTAILLIGLLMLAGVMKNPFGIPQKIWSGTLGLGALLLLLGYYFDSIWTDQGIRVFDPPDPEIGLWVAFGGAGLAVIQMILTFFYERKTIFSDRPIFSDTTKTALSGVTVIAIVSSFVLPYGSFRGNTVRAAEYLLPEDVEGTYSLLDDELAGTGLITLILLFSLLIATYMSLHPKTQLPKGIFLILSGALVFLHTPFIFRSLTLGSDSSPLGIGHAAEAANWVNLFCAGIIFVLIFRSGSREQQGIKERLG